MNFDDINETLREARRALNLVDINSNHMARLIVGRLRHVHNDQLIQLKKELKNFNAVTGEWK